jgi:hypothetical protein
MALDAVDEAVRRAVQDVAADVGVEAGQARAHIGPERSRDAAANPIFVALRDRYVPEKLKLARRAPGRDVEHAGARVLAEQGTLRATQHFDALQIDEVDEALALPRKHHPVEDDRHARLEPGAEQRGADAADAKVAVLLVGRLGEGKGGDLFLEVLRRFDAAVHQVLGGQRGDGDRHVLEALLAALGGDDDIPKPVLFGRRGGRCRRGSGGCALGMGGAGGKRCDRSGCTQNHPYGCLHFLRPLACVPR